MQFSVALFNGISYECAEQTFSRYYANTLSSYVVNSNQRSKHFDSWKSVSPDAFLSNWKKQELKAVVLEETLGFYNQRAKVK